MIEELDLMSNQTFEITGQVQGIIFTANDSFYKVISVKIDEINFEYEGDEINVTGSFGDIKIGSNYQFIGKLKNHARFGKQFVSEHYKRLDINSKNGLIQYLSGSDFSGIGIKTAEKIVNNLGTNAIDKILDSSVVLNNLGLSQKQINTIVEQLKQSDGMERSIIALNQFGFSSFLANVIYNYYENETLEIIKNDPYRMVLDIDGVSFNRIDQIVLQEGLDPFDSRRIQSGIVAAMNRATFERGDTFVKLDVLIQNTKYILEQNNNINIKIDLIQKALFNLVEQEIIVDDDNRLFMSDLYYAETGISQRIMELNNQKSNFKYNEVEKSFVKMKNNYNLKYTEEQHEAILAALTNKLFILTGGPGTGKTTIIKGIVVTFQELLKQNGLNQSEIEKSIKLAAPTGRAAKRLSEATSMSATTIHRLLGISSHENLSNVNLNFLEGQLLIIDEMSMVDTELFNLLLKNTPNSMQVILVGDKNQLPSVGPGKVFNDLLDSGKLNYQELVTIHRQEANSSIIELANEVKQGKLPDDLMKRQDDRSFFPAHVTQIPIVIKKVIVSWIEHGHSAKDMQILSPMYKTAAGVNQLNLLAQNLFNPNTNQKREIMWREGDFEFHFRIGDKVMQKVNNPENDIFNGDIGYIKTIMFSKDPENELKVDYIEIDFDGNIVLYQRSDFINITLAYATTIHKAQGSEYSLVILPLIKSFNRMLQRNLLYTGLTRAKDSLVLIGEPDSYQKAVQTEGVKRNTMLLNRLENIVCGDTLNKSTNMINKMNDEQFEDKLKIKLLNKNSNNKFPRLTLEMIENQKIDSNIGMMEVSPYDFM